VGSEGPEELGEKPSIGVCDFMNSGETPESPSPKGVRVKMGDKKGGGGVAEAGGQQAARSCSSALTHSISFLETGGRGGQEEEEGPGGPDLRQEPQDCSDFFAIERKDPEP
jgi:hypothetical protein